LARRKTRKQRAKHSSAGLFIGILIILIAGVALFVAFETDLLFSPKPTAVATSTDDPYADEQWDDAWEDEPSPAAADISAATADTSETSTAKPEPSDMFPSARSPETDTEPSADTISSVDDAPKATVSTATFTPVDSYFGLQPTATEHYLIYARATAAGQADIAARLESIYAEYRREMGQAFKPASGKAKAFFMGAQPQYVAAGGEPSAPGVFRVIDDSVGPRLVLRHGGDNMYIEITQLLQHEGWHQFNWRHIRQYAPIWMDEGLATYFSYGVWTGDITVYGGIHGSVRRLLLECARNFMPLKQYLTLDDNTWRQWQKQVGFWTPYMQGFSLIQFLKHADGGRYERRLNDYIADVSSGRDTAASARAIASLERRWLRWISSFKDTTAQGPFFEAIAATVTGHLVRCHINGQSFETMDDFLTAARTGRLELGPVGSDTWLPPSVMQETIRCIDMYGKGYTQRGWGPFKLTIESTGGLPAARVRLGKMGLDLRAVAAVSDGKVDSVTIKHRRRMPAAMR
jgi:hypothetical protein